MSATNPCEYCDGRVRPRRVTVDPRRGDDWVVVENVPAGVCDRCRYQYFSAEVAGRLQQLFSKRTKARKKLTVPVVKFGSVA